MNVDETMTANDAALTEELRSAIGDARARIGALLDPACPTATFLGALGEELDRAAADASSVPYPELIDPDAYWTASVKPQMASLRDAAGDIIAWLEERIVGIMAVAEEDLKSMVESAVADTGLDSVAKRADLASRIDHRCMGMHHLMAEVLEILPSLDRLHEAASGVESELRRRASSDVDTLKPAYLREAGGDDDHQRFAEQRWSETFAERVAHREALLRGDAPWRHMELALTGYERAQADVERLVEAAVVRLQAPLLDMRALLVQRYDDLVAAGTH